MIKILALLLISSSTMAQVSATYLPVEDDAAFVADVNLKGKYNYNIYYTFDRPVSDFSAVVSPQIKAQTKPRFVQLSTKIEGAYEKYFTQINQDYFDYNIQTKTSVNDGGTSSLILDLNFDQFSDPASSATEQRPTHQRSEAKAHINYKKENGNLVKVSANYKMEDITVPSYTFNKNYLRHYNVDLVGEYDFRFLPETYWFLRLTGGMREYLNPRLDSTSISQYVTDSQYQSIKTRSTYALGEIGLSGRLTDKTTLDAATGFLTRLYPYGDSFIAPVFYIHFIEQVTKRDQLIAGYNYVVEDSYSTNWLLNQEIYLGLARVMGDQVLLLMKLTYEYKNYSTPVARNDQRVTGGGIIKFSFNPTYKFFAEMKVDLMATDYFYTLSLPNPDKPGSYRAGYVGAGVSASF